MLTLSSRYTTDVAQDGRVIAVRKPKFAVNYTVYTVRDGDTIEILSAKAYGDPTQYWRIADMNPHIPFPDDLIVGDTLRIPK
jgi:nucleoid-associated protein YgaU